MKNIFCFLGIISLFSFINEILSQTVDKYTQDGVIYLKFKDNIYYKTKAGKISIEDIEFINRIKEKYGIRRVINPFWRATDKKLHKIFKVEFDSIYKVDLLIEDLKKIKDVEYVEKAPYYWIKYTPNDYPTDGVKNWHLEKIMAKEAWDITQGNSNIKIAIIDNAIDITHPDLSSKVVLAIDLADGDDDPTPPENTTIWSHGTHVAGLAAAATNNGLGIASIGFNCSIIAIKAARDSDNGQGIISMYEGIIWAADNGAHIINMSFGGPGYFQTMQMIIDYAYNKGCVLVGGAGNNGDGSEDPNNINYVTYPAACNHVIAVGATNGNDVAASFSNYGAWIDVMAPGGYQNDGGWSDILFNRSVYSTIAGGGYNYMAGTSMAAPIVAGLCGLMKSVNPYLTPDKLTYYLKISCDTIDHLQDSQHQGMIGAGRINAFKAVKTALDSISPIVANFTCSGNHIIAGGHVNFTDLSIGNIIQWNWQFPGGEPSSSTLQNPQNITYNQPGSFDVILTVSDGTTTSTEIKPNFINVFIQPQSGWIEQASGFSAIYRGAYNISIANDSVAWATAVDGTTGYPVNEFTKTTNGGDLWIANTIPAPNTLAPANICALSHNEAWVAMYPTNGSGGKIYYTEDGGQTWTIKQSANMFSSTSSFLNVVHFWNSYEGFCMGDPVNNNFEIYYTTDGGNTWTPSSTLPPPLPGEYGYTGIYDVYNNTVWFGTNKGRIYKSTDKGKNWTVYNTGLSDIAKVTFNDENNGIVQQITYGSGGTITSFIMKVTHDGGETWTTITPNGPIWKTDICAVPGVPGKYFSVGTNGQSPAKYGSSFSLDYGLNWTLIDTGIQYISVEFLNDNTGWAGGFSLNETTGGIYKWNTFTKSNKTPKISPQLYPNPSANFIELNSPNKILLLEIFDNNGKKIKSYTPNSLKVFLNISNLQDGFYIIKITTETNVITKKFIKE